MKIKAIANGPIVVETDNGEKVVLCRCGKTKNSPFCDDSHHTYRRGMAPIEIEQTSIDPFAMLDELIEASYTSFPPQSTQELNIYICDGDGISLDNLERLQEQLYRLAELNALAAKGVPNKNE